MPRTLAPVLPCSWPVRTVARPRGALGKERGAPAPIFGVGRGRQGHGAGRRAPALQRTLKLLPPSRGISTSDTRFVTTCFQRGADGEAAGCDPAALHGASPSRARRRQKSRLSARSTGTFTNSPPKGSGALPAASALGTSPGSGSDPGALPRCQRSGCGRLHLGAYGTHQ